MKCGHQSMHLALRKGEPEERGSGIVAHIRAPPTNIKAAEFVVVADNRFPMAYKSINLLH